MSSRIIQTLRRLRRNLLPPTAADTARRFDSMSARLDTFEAAVRSRLPLHRSRTTQAQVLPVLRLIVPRRVPAHRMIRAGSANDGGYVMLDDFAGLGCALSFGINDNDSWDLCVAERGVPVHQFDHSVEHAPSTHPLLSFHKMRIATMESLESETLPGLLTKLSGGTIPDILLKMDIEGDEWAVLDECPLDLLKRCAQVICEFHNLNRLDEAEFLSLAHRVFEKLSECFAVVHVHGNNCGSLVNVSNIALPDTLEITFANTERYTATESIELFPTPLDMANDANTPDIYLGAFRY